LASLNDDEPWRLLLGQPRRDRRLRDVELVLRVLALADEWRGYVKSMKGHLNRYMDELASKTAQELDDICARFRAATQQTVTALGERPFHIRTRLNVAALDGFLGSVVAANGQNRIPLGVAWRDLREDAEFIDVISFNTSDTEVVRRRFEM